MSSTKRSLQNLLFSAVGQVVTVGFGLLLPRLLLVNYGSEVNGLLNSLNQILVYLTLFEAGIGTAALQALYGPVAKEDWTQISGVLAAANRYYKKAGLWYLFALVGLSFVYPLVVPSELSYLTVCGTVFFSGIGNVVLFYFQAKYRYLLLAQGKTYIISNLLTVSCVLTSVCKIVLFERGANIVLVLALTSVFQAAQALYIVWYIHRSCKDLNLDAEPDYQSISQKNSVLIHQISSLIFNNTDVLLLTVVCGLKVVSVYAMFKLVSTALESILGIFSGSVRFALGQSFQTDFNRFVTLIDLFEAYYSAICFAVFSVALYLYLPFIRLYTAGVTDIRYDDARLPVLFVLIALLNQMRVPMCETINFAGHFKQTVSRTVLESAINLVVSVVTVYFLGIYGVLIGTVVALFYRTNDIIIYTNVKILHRKPWKTYWVYTVNSILFVIVQLLLKQLPLAISGYGTLVFAGLLSGLLALAIFFSGQSLCTSQGRSFVHSIFCKFTNSHKIKTDK